MVFIFKFKHEIKKKLFNAQFRLIKKKKAKQGKNLFVVYFYYRHPLFRSSYMLLPIISWGKMLIVYLYDVSAALNLAPETYQLTN